MYLFIGAIKNRWHSSTEFLMSFPKGKTNCCEELEFNSLLLFLHKGLLLFLPFFQNFSPDSLLDSSAEFFRFIYTH